MNNPNYYEKRECIVCKKPFFTYKESLRGRRQMPDGLRGQNCLTCSFECSKVYNRFNLEKRRALKNKFKCSRSVV